MTGDIAFELPQTGTLVTEHIFYALWPDDVLFTCTGPDGRRWICSCCRLYNEWVAAPADRDALLRMIADEIPIRDLFPPDSRIAVTWDGNKFNETRGCDESWLPAANALLELPPERTDAFRQKLLKESETST